VDYEEVISTVEWTYVSSVEFGFWFGLANRA